MFNFHLKVINSMIKLVFASTNEKKIIEVREHLKEKYEILSLHDLGFFEDIAETGTTFHENAAIKAKFIYEKYKLNCFADDSGLEVEALLGAPGVYSARFAGEHKSYIDNNLLLLKKMQGINNRKATFKTVIALVLNGKIHYFEGLIEGTIQNTLKGDTYFGYDPLFLPIGYDKTFAEMSLQKKNEISHRAKAVNKLVDFLKK